MTEKSEALRLAQELDAYHTMACHKQSAAELRRLHAENERLHQINQSHEMKLSVRGYEIQIEDLRLAHAELHALNGELLEALKLALSAHGVMLLSDPPQEAWKTYGVEQKARAAIAKAEGGQG
jgi:hypothetical protein